MRLILSAALGVLLLTLSVQGQQIHRNPFEGRETAWQKGKSDAQCRLRTHEVTNQLFHTGQQSEHVAFEAGQGSHLYYVYPVGKADIAEELTIGVWVRANRPGAQLLARVVLPRERDPQNLDVPLTTLIRGDSYRLTGRWQPLKLPRPAEATKDQQRLMRAEFNRDVNFQGAYVDQVILNVYAGPGLNEIWIDDLEIGPVSEPVHRPPAFSVPSPRSTTEREAQPTGRRPIPEIRNPKSKIRNRKEASIELMPPRHAVVELADGRLHINRRPFFIRGIRHSDTPLKALRDAGFNTLWIDYTTPDEVFAEAVGLGFWLVPNLPVLEDKSRVGSASGLAREIGKFAYNDAVLAWEVGSGFTDEHSEPVGRAAGVIREADPQKGRPVAGDIWDGFRPFSRHLDLVGVHRWPLMTGLELGQYHAWLKQRRQLARPGTYMWTWVQTHLPDWYTGLVYEQSGMQNFSEPIGPQPEQIRLCTYIALAAGYRGIGFWSDRFLANSHHGRDRLLALALLNQELELLEPLLATAKEPTWINTKHPEVKAALFDCDKGLLVLPIWLGRGAQWVPGQLATRDLEIVVPKVPQDATAWEVSAADVRGRHGQRVPGGVKVVIPEFGLTTALVFTSDIDLIGRLQQGVRKTQKLAAQWSYDLAIEELQKVEKVNGQLEQMGQGLRDGRELMEDARKRLEVARREWHQDTPTSYAESYGQSQRALRPLRLLMRAQWEKAVRTLDTPVASPYAVGYFTLPKHWQLMGQINGTQAGANLLPAGGFEVSPAEMQRSWALQEVTLDDVELAPHNVNEQPKQGGQCLRLTVKAKDLKNPPEALERTYLAVNSPTVRVQPGSVVRITGWIRIPEPIQASADGVLFFDSIGGEPLAVRLTEGAAWRRFTLYRLVPPTGTVRVTMALTGIGTAYFDDIRIEPLYGVSQPTAQATSPGGR